MPFSSDPPFSLDPISPLDALAREKQTWRSRLLRHIHKLKKKEEELRANLERCAQWPRIRHEAELIKFHFASLSPGASSVLVYDWLNEQPCHLTLDPAKTVQEEMTARYRRAKKWEAAMEPLKGYLDTILSKIQKLEESLHSLDVLHAPDEVSLLISSLAVLLPQPGQRVTRNAPHVLLPFKEYRSASGTRIWVGKNAAANEALTFQFAHGRDWWLHASGFSGSHVVIRMAKEQQPDAETLQDALQLALYHSKARAHGESTICVTQRKYVSKGGSRQKGLVHIAKHRSMWVRFDEARYRGLRERTGSSSTHREGAP